MKMMKFSEMTEMGNHILRERLEDHGRWLADEEEDAQRLFLKDTKLYSPDFSLMNIRDTRFDNCFLMDPNFKAADMANIWFRECCIQSGDFMNAAMDDTDLDTCVLLDPQNLLSLNPIDTWHMYLVRHDNEPMIKAGCRWFTYQEAKDWWDPEHHDAGYEHCNKMMAGVHCLMEMARSLGWKMG
jgi:hypothetical protein